jgi:hypothetical protein
MAFLPSAKLINSANAKTSARRPLAGRIDFRIPSLLSSESMLPIIGLLGIDLWSANSLLLMTGRMNKICVPMNRMYTNLYGRRITDVSEVIF